LLFTDGGVKNPETKNSVGIKKMSRTKKSRPDNLFVAGSSTIQKEAQIPLLSYTPPA